MNRTPVTRTAGGTKVVPNAPELLKCLIDLLEETNPFMTDVDGCECGPNASGFDDNGNPCIHILCMRAISKAKGI